MIEIKETNNNYFEKEFEVKIDEKSYFITINYISYFDDDIYYFRSIDYSDLPNNDDLRKEVLNKLKISFPTQFKITKNKTKQNDNRKSKRNIRFNI